MQQLHELAKDGSYVYLRVQDTNEIDGEPAGRPWYTLQIERRVAGAWKVTRVAGDDLEALLTEISQPPEKERKVRRVRRRR